jgi:hypothetical protein
MTRTALLALTLTACTATHEPAPEPTPEPAPAPSVEPGEDGHKPEVVPELAPPAEQATPPEGVQAGPFPLPSTWASPACEGRDYERQISFDADRFAAVDLVAPCPPGTQCVWSGIIDRKGSWSLDRKQLRLLPDTDASQSPQASKFPLPQHLWLGAEGTLTEDDGACPYVMAPTQ